MNPITASEKIESLARIAGVAVPRNAPLVCAPAGWTRIINEQMIDDSVAGGAEKPFDEEGTPKTPFPFMRCVWPPSGHNGYQFSAKGVIFQRGFSIRGVIEKTVNEFSALFRCDHKESGELTEMFQDGEWRELIDEEIRGQVTGTFYSMLWFFNSNIMHTVKVSPPVGKANGKSKEWKEAREFYTVVHRRHAANAKGVAQGAVVGDKTSSLTAHSRRAHVRILKDPRFKLSVGKKIWVKSCWVGPKQWQDAESKQVYTIVP